MNALASTLCPVMDSPLPGSEEAPPLSAPQKRAAQSALAQWALEVLAPQVPLRFPVESGLAPSPKRRYRSHYQPPTATNAPDPSALAVLSDFEQALRLIDFSPLEGVLTQHYRPSAKGQVPFHPVSLFLAILLRRELALGWRAIARLLAGPHGAAWRPLLGFTDAHTPSASGLRFFFQAVGPEVFDDLCPRFIALLRAYDLFPTHSTFPGDPPARGVSVSQDGMLHDAHDRSHCFFATSSCYQPLPPAAIPLTPVDSPPAAPSRPCPAQEKGHHGCACNTQACAQRCTQASPTDREARFIHYAGHNAKHGEKKESKGKGRDVFGYRSIVERVLDDRFAVAWTVRSSLYPANTDERNVFVARVQALQTALPNLKIGEWLADSGLGYGPCLEAVWDLGALRMIDPRADKSDADPQAWVQRGYDAAGRPLCPHGYRLRANGYDAERRRAKFICHQACVREPLTQEGPITPVDGCPYRDHARPSGFIVNVGKTLPDGSVRLAREIPPGSAAWKARYGRRNLSECRNSQIRALGLKRFAASGLDHNTREIQLADFLINLRTLGRLVREASAA